MKKGILAALAALAAGSAGTALYTYSFPPWKPALYIISVVIIAAAFGVLSFVYSRAAGKNKPAVKALITFAVSFSVIILLVLLVNNLILHSVKSTLAAIIIASVLCVALTLAFAVVTAKCGKSAFLALVSIFIVAAIGFAPLIPEAKREYLIKNPGFSPKPAVESNTVRKEKTMVTDADFYVSPSGDDKNDGSFEHPLATIEKARELVRVAEKKPGGITVAIMAGEYRVDSLEFGSEDSGSAECPIKYCAYGDGEVILNGGITLAPESFEPVSGEAAKRLDAEAAKSILCTDLKKLGLTAENWGKIYAIGSYNTAASYDGDYVGGIYCELFVNDKRQVLARYPNDEYLYTEKVIKIGCGRESDGALTAVENWDDIRNPEPDVYGISSKLAKRIASWKTLDDVWMFGFWKYDWADASSPIGEFSEQNRTLSPKFVSTYGTKTDAPYYFFNVFEELDAPGEWYLDRESGMLYVYPENGISGAEIDLSLSEKPVITVKDAEYITFDSLTLKGTRGNAMELSGNSLTVCGCLIKNIAGNAILMDGSNNLADGNEITRTGKGGITINGGDRETLTPGGSRAVNNLIHDWSEIYQTYQPAVSLNGVGNICAHNEMFNSPHEAITYSGNDQLIEYNLIHDVCLLTDDGGAIYSGRRWDFYGCTIRYNCIYDLGSNGHRPDGIYMDDALSGQTIIGNLLVNVPKIGIHLGGGRDMTVKNNIIVNTVEKSISYDSRAIEGVFGGWFTHSSQKGGDMWQNLFDSPWQTEKWKKAYPQMQKFSNDFENTDDPGFVPNPAFSDVSCNIIVNPLGEIGGISDAAQKYSTIANNAVMKLSRAEDIFTDYDKGDYTVKQGSEALSLAPGFEDIPFEKIGRNK